MLWAEREGAGRRLVLVHGFTQTGRHWADVADQLVGDHEVVLVDAPGHGHSAGVAADLWTGAGLVGDQGGEATYLGYSMGGRFCLHLALARPRLVRGLVLVGATAGLDDAGVREERRRADEVLARRLEEDGLDAFLAGWLAQPLFAGLTESAQGYAARRQNTPAGLAASLRTAGTGIQEPLWDRLGELTMPVLVVAGERDAKFAALGRRLADGIGPNAALALLPGAGHAAHGERPAQFLAVLGPWLAEHGL